MNVHLELSGGAACHKISFNLHVSCFPSSIEHVIQRTQVGPLFRRTNELNTYNSAETITDPRSVLVFLR